MPTAEEQQAVEEALERLLDPLAEDRPAAADAAPLPPMPEVVPLYERGPSVRHLAVRLRRSHRGGFRVARRLVGWTVGLAAFWGVVWVILSFGGVR